MGVCGIAVLMVAAAGLVLVLAVAVVALAIVVVVAVSAASLTRLAGRSFMPHVGQRSGLSLVTSGCIGQT